MVFLPIAAAVGASTGWATGIVLAERPARVLGAFEFTRIQLTACAALLALICTFLGYWPFVLWHHWPSFALSTLIGIVLGNLAMIECLRLGGPRRTELLLSLKGPVVALMAYLWLGEVLSKMDILGGLVVLTGILLAIQAGAEAPAAGARFRGNLAAVVLTGIAATVCQGFGFLVLKPAMTEGMAPLAVSAIRLLGAAFLISVVALWPARLFRPRARLTPALLGRTILPGVIGYVVSSSLLLYAFANFHAGLAAILGSLSPVIVLPILWLKEKRPPRPMAVLGALAAICGTAMIVLL